VYIQELLGSIDGRLTSGFTRSSISSLPHTGFLEWWEIAQRAFSQEFVSWVNSEISSGKIEGIHAGVGRKIAATED